MSDYQINPLHEFHQPPQYVDFKSTTSWESDKLYAALGAFQADIDGVPKTRQLKTPRFTSHYADLGDVMAAIKPLLAKHGLCYTQPGALRPCSYQVRQEEKGEDGKWHTAQVKNVEMTGNVVVTRVIHIKSGQWIQGETFFPPDTRGGQSLPQACAVAHTYARRYALCAILGIPLEDEDGAAEFQRQPQERQPKAQKSTNSQPAEKRPPGKKPTKSAINKVKKQLEAAAENGPRAWQEQWQKVDIPTRQALIRADTEDGWLTRLKQDMQGVTQV